jgi:hypothetical protein
MNKLLPKYIILLIALLVTKRSISQSSITFDAGQVFSTYKFTDAQGVQEKDFTDNITGCFSLGYQFTTQGGLFIRSNVGMRKAGASNEYNGIPVSWNLQYADADVGVGYILNKWRLKPYVYAAPYFGYLLKANQTIGSNTYDILKNKSVKTSDYGVFLSPGLKITLSNYISCYVEYKYILGLNNTETATDQKSYNRGFSINLGVAVSLIRYNYVTVK